MTATKPPEEPPDAPDLGISCPRCGSGDVRRTAKRLGAGWTHYLRCGECGEDCGPDRRKRKAKAALPPPAQLPPGELVARSGSLDAAAAANIDDLEVLVDRAVHLSGAIMESQWGPMPMPPGRRLAIRAVTTAAIATLSEENIQVLTAKYVVEDEPALAAAWVGWSRQKGQHWQIVCEAASEEECLNRLLDLARGSDHMVLPRGKSPGGFRRRML